MKVLLLLALSPLASTTWTCEECQDLTGTMMARLSTEEDMVVQSDLLLAEVCPQVEDVDGCVEGLPDFWQSLAPTLWMGVFNPAVWCRNICQEKAVRDVTCEECLDFLATVLVTFTNPEAIQHSVDIMSGPAFCETLEEVEECRSAIAVLLPLAFPVLAGRQDQNTEIVFCNEILGVC